MSTKKNPIFTKSVHTNIIRLLSIICGFIGILEFIFGVEAFGVIVDEPWGCWWAGLILIFMSITGFMPKNGCGLGTSMAFSIPAIIGLIAAVILDGYSYKFMESMKSCSNSEGDNYGNSDYFVTSTLCAQINDAYDCSCVEETLAENSNAECYTFNLSDGSNNCEPLLNLASTLHNSYSLCIIALLFTFAFSILTCCGICCAETFIKEEDDKTENLI
jgi:hypothetical protein